MPETLPGRVIIAYSQDSLVEAQGRIYRCQTRRSTGKPYTGDWVRISLSGSDGGVIEAIEPRRNLIARPNFRDQLKPFAANVDLMVIVVASKPQSEPLLVDRYLVLAEHLDITGVVWANKIDLLTDDPARQAFLDKLKVYESLGYQVLAGSAESGQGVDALEAALSGRTGILVGQSGVGKSSLIKRLLPDLDLRIGALSEASGLGRHTTTETTLYHLNTGGDLIDSPGIRTLRLGHLTPQELQAGFRELRELAGRCRFPDCRHETEPDCVVRDAVARGAVSPQRLGAFHALLRSETRPADPTRGRPPRR